MKLANIHPKITAFKLGRVTKVGEWSFEDHDDIMDIRQVFHYDTLMGQFVNTPNWGWTFEPISTGWGSASDQQGMNKMMMGEWTYRRNNNDPRYEAYDGVTIVRD